MNVSSQEVYLGDKINKSGKIEHTLDSRIARGYGAITTILAILTKFLLLIGDFKRGFNSDKLCF